MTDEAAPGCVHRENTGALIEPATRLTRRVSAALLDGDAALERALVALGRKSDARQVTFAWPNIGECNRRLAHYLTEAYPDRRGDSLLANILDEAFGAYECAEPGVETAPVRAYLHALLGCAPRILAFDLFGARAHGRTLRWAPFGEPVADWARAEGVSELVFEPAHALREALSTRECVRWMLCARVLRFEDVGILQSVPLPPAPPPVPTRARRSYLKRVK